MSKKLVKKADIVRKIELEFELENNQAHNIMDCIIDTIRDGLLNGKKVILKNIGTFQPEAKKPETTQLFGKIVEAGHRLKVKFIPSTSLNADYKKKHDPKLRAETEMKKLADKL